MEVKRIRRSETHDGLVVMQELDNGEWMIVVTNCGVAAAVTISRAEARKFASFINGRRSAKTRR